MWFCKSPTSTGKVRNSFDVFDDDGWKIIQRAVIAKWFYGSSEGRYWDISQFSFPGIKTENEAFLQTAQKKFVLIFIVACVCTIRIRAIAILKEMNLVPIVSTMPTKSSALGSGMRLWTRKFAKSTKSTENLVLSGFGDTEILWFLDVSFPLKNTCLFHIRAREEWPILLNEIFSTRNYIQMFF